MDALDVFLKDKKQEQFNINESFFIRRIKVGGLMVFDCTNGSKEFSSRDKRVARNWIKYQLEGKL